MATRPLSTHTWPAIFDHGLSKAAVYREQYLKRGAEAAGTMRPLTFEQLNQGWNAEPNAPTPIVEVERTSVRLSFYLNPFKFSADVEEVALLTFAGARQWRLGPTNDEGWSRGQCRYSGSAPTWGEFYRIIGDDPVRSMPSDWTHTDLGGWNGQHFLFYLKDETFECIADEWSLQRGLSRAVAENRW